MKAALAGLALAVAASAADAHAQVKRVAIVANTVPLSEWSARALPDGSPHAGQAIREGLEKLGWVDGKNVRLLWRSAEGRLERLERIFEELVGSGVDVIVAIGPGTGAAARVTRTTPIVMAVSAGALGSVAGESLARPDRNLTGLTLESGAEMETKRLSLLKQAIPGARRIALLQEGKGPCLSPSSSLRAAADSLGLSLFSVSFDSAETLERAFEVAVTSKADAMLVCDGIWVYRYGTQRAINGLARRLRLPVMHTASGGADTGGLLAYGIDTMIQYRRVPYFVDRILRGAKPSQLPIEQPMAVELVVNLDAARALGLTIPKPVLLQANRVVP